MANSALLAQAKTTTADHTKVPETFEREIPPAGPTPARFIGYVEIGKRPQEFNGKPKAPCLEALLFFELNGKKHVREVDTDEGKKTFTNRAMIRLAVKTADRASFGKLFRAMRQGREDITSMAHMLGEGFVVHVVHNEVGEGDKKRTYINLRDDSGWRVGPPIIVDPLDPDNVTQIPIPEPRQDLMLLLWDNPTKEQWDSLFIDGTHTRKIDGKDAEVSNNWIQQSIVQEAVDFDSSPLADLLAGIGGLDFEPSAPGEAQEGGQDGEGDGAGTEPSEEDKAAALAAEQAALVEAEKIAAAKVAKKEAASKEVKEPTKEPEAKEEDKAPKQEESADDILAKLGL